MPTLISNCFVFEQDSQEGRQKLLAAAPHPRTPASPRNTSIARLTSAIAPGLSKPNLFPRRSRGRVVILSIITYEVFRRPFSGLGSTSCRPISDSIRVVVNRQTVIDPVAAKLSSWTMSTGRGFPA